MPLAAGARLGPYEIVSALGAGGMGEVYKARDTRLERRVAIKVLAPEISGDPDQRARFEQEARAVAALDHPHICGIYDVGSVEGTYFLVMPHLEGQTLAARLEKGPLPLDQALKIATEIADALDKAHRQGITHRDLKPANIMLTKSGAKLLDFGLAKLKAPASPISMSAMAKLATATPNTAHGMILGTVQYMAPEQLEGKPADERSDIWALGTVIYEMIAGARPFSGDSPASIIGSILKDQPPPVSARQPLTPPALDRTVAICLAKDPDERWQSAHDLKLEIASVFTTAAPTASSGRSSRWPMAAAVALIGVVGGAMGMWLLGRTATPAVSEGTVVQHVTRLTNEGGLSEWPTWSPDGKTFAYSSNRTGSFEIHVRRIEAGEDVNVTRNAADDVQPSFSPDGTSIAFVSTRSSRTGLIKVGTFISFDTRTFGGDIWVIPTLGGQARRLATDGNFPVWHPSGRSVLYVTGAENQRTILEVPIDGGTASTLLPETDSRWEILRLGYAPSSRWITFETATREVFALSARGGTPVLLFHGSNHVWDHGGDRLYYVNQEAGGGTRIEMAEVQESGQGLTTKRIMVAGVSTGILKELAISSDGQRLLATGVEESLSLARVPLASNGASVTGAEEALSQGQVRDRYPSVSPDGNRIAVGSNRIGQNDLWWLDLPSRQWNRIPEARTETDGGISQACWARDEQHLVVMHQYLDNTVGYWYIALDGSTSKELIARQPGITGTFPCAVASDGHSTVYSHVVEGFNQLFVFDLDSRIERQLTKSRSHKYQAAWSPDGRWVAFSANTGGTVQVWRIPAAGGDEQQLTTGLERNLHLFYSPDGRYLYVQPSHRNIWRMPADGGPLQNVTRFPESGLFLEEPTMSPDGRWLAYNKGGGGSSLWMLTIGAH